jgi:predicted nicotinamide N-methyase
MSRPCPSHPEQFIARNLPLAPVPSLPGVRLHLATPQSGLKRLQTGTPYWAYVWAGGLALASYIAEHPETVAGRHVLDLGSGSGLVGIAAAKAGALSVIASDTDANALRAVAMNAHANGVAIDVVPGDLLDGPVPASVDMVLVGDLFYAPRLARRLAGFLDRCLETGVTVLVGDPGRKPLPLPRLRRLGEYRVADFGTGNAAVAATVYMYR